MLMVAPGNRITLACMEYLLATYICRHMGTIAGCEACLYI